MSVNYIAKHANHAFGAIIAKCEAMGGFLFKCFTKLFESVLLPIIVYDFAVWGCRNYCFIDVIFNCACRFNLGVGKHTANAAIQGDIGCKEYYLKHAI